MQELRFSRGHFCQVIFAGVQGVLRTFCVFFRVFLQAVCAETCGDNLRAVS
jgi:hypothetical protein